MPCYTLSGGAYVQRHYRQRPHSRPGQPADRRLQRDDLPAAAPLPHLGAGRGAGFSGRHRGGGGVDSGAAQTGFGDLVRPGAAPQAPGAFRLRSLRPGAAAGGAGYRAAGGSRHSLYRPHRQGGAHLAARCPDRRLGGAAAARPRLRLPPLHGSCRSAARTVARHRALGDLDQEPAGHLRPGGHPGAVGGAAYRPQGARGRPRGGLPAR